jgi:hypothetical protein
MHGEYNVKFSVELYFCSLISFYDMHVTNINILCAVFVSITHATFLAYLIIL